MNIINPFESPSSGLQFYHGPQASFVISNALIIKEINQQAETSFGVRKNLALGKNFLEICKDRRINSLIQEHVKFILSGNNYELEENLLVKINETESIFKIGCSPISGPSAPQGIYDLIMIVCSELSPSQLNKAKAIPANELPKPPSSMDFSIKKAFQMAEVSLYWMDRDHIYRGCSLWTCHLVGVKSPEEVIGRTIFDLAKINDWPQYRAQELYDIDERVMEKGIPEFNIAHVLPQGNDSPPVHQYGTKYAIFNRQGKVIGLVGAAIDMLHT